MSHKFLSFEINKVIVNAVGFVGNVVSVLVGRV